MTPHAAPDFPDHRSKVLAWRGLILGVIAQLFFTIVISGPAFLIPHLRTDKGFTLAEAGMAGTSTSVGMVITLVAWGALADRRGERLALSLGLLLCAVSTAGGFVLAVAGLLDSLLPLVLVLALAGGIGASVNTATGRVVAGWFPRHQRGTAMGIRQMAQPLGTAVAAVLVPPLAALWGIAGFFAVTSVLCLLIGIGCVLGVVDPPRPGRRELAVPDPDGAAAVETAEPLAGEASEAGRAAGGGQAPVAGRNAGVGPGDGGRNSAGASAVVNPYREDSFLWRIHAVSALLVVPQITFATFGLVWLIDTQDLSAQTAGLLVGVAQLAGAFARLTMGRVSDRAPSRVIVLRWVAWAAALLTGAVAVVSLGVLPVLAGALFALASAASVADNGLAFTSIAEASGSRWSGKAMGIQNTGQHLLSAGVGPGIGALIATLGYPLALGCVAVIPVAASFLVPERDLERT